MKPESSRRAPQGWTTPAQAVAHPTVVEALRIEEPDLGEGHRHVIVRWSDGSTGRALSYFADEILIGEGNMVGRTAGEVRALHFSRDRDYLQRGD
jgi:hypothetical protein